MLRTILCTHAAPNIPVEKRRALADSLAHRLDFKAAFVDRIGAIAEQEGHHPNIALSWGRVVVTLWTHKIHGLSEADFVLAAKIERAFAT